MLYTIEIENRGPAGAAGVVFDDTPDANTRLIAGSVATNVGSLALGNGSDDTALRVNVGNLPPDATVRISFSVLILNDAPAAFDRVTNQGAVASGNAVWLPTDDPLPRNPATARSLRLSTRRLRSRCSALARRAARTGSSYAGQPASSSILPVSSCCAVAAAGAKLFA